MIVLGYSGLDQAVAFAKRDLSLRPGEERMVQGMDSAAALTVGGRIIAAVAEERLTGAKHTNVFPEQAIRYCLSSVGLAPNDIDAVAHGFNYAPYAAFFRSRYADYYDIVVRPEAQVELWKNKIDRNFNAEKFRPIEHHLAHAASCYFVSGFENALCVVSDGMGEFASLTVYAATRSGFRTLDSVPVSSSVGILYGIVTRHLGFEFNADEYKVMGLAPYGDPSRYRSVFEEITELKSEGKYSLLLDRIGASWEPYHRGVLRHLDTTVIPSRQSDAALEQSHADFAAAAQECVERILLHVLSHWRAATGFRLLCMAGGVCLNCTANGKILRAGLFDDIFVQPAAGDDGSALGAALCVSSEFGEVPSDIDARSLPLWGPSYTREEILSAVSPYANQVILRNFGNEAAAAKDAAQGLLEDQVIAWFQGRMEYGPRALGNRSILANPLKPDIKERLNRIVKLREDFRPFAPAVIESKACDYFELQPSPLLNVMLATCPVRERWRDRLPGITHVDGSARVQTVSARTNPLFHALITEFGDLSGVYCVVNTSFNLRGQPIIVSPEIAVETFLRSGLDRLYLGSIGIARQSATSWLA